jgi:lipoprotein-releasing system permease protein
MNWLFAWRYFKSKKSTAAVNIIAWVGVTAIAVGTAALIIVFSVFNGFEGLVKSLYSSFYAQIRITNTTGKSITVTDSLLQKINNNNSVSYVCKYIEENALVLNGDYQHIVRAKGVDSLYPNVSGMSATVYAGSYELGDTDKPLCVVGNGVENALNISAEKNLEALTIYLPKSVATESLQTMDGDNLSADNINTTGVFKIQQDFDSRYLITNIGFMQRMMAYDSTQCTGLELAVSSTANEEKVAADLQKTLGNNYKVEDRYMQNKNLYNVMRMEKWIIYAVLVLILIISAFTITGALTMLIVEKKQDMQILLAIGTAPNQRMKIFLNTGFLMTIIGCAIGCTFGLLICFLQIKFEFIKLQGQSFIINYYPVEVLLSDVLVTIATVAIIAIGASYFPARKLKKLDFEIRSY